MKKLGFLLVVMVGFAVSSFGQSKAHANTTVEFVTPISVVNTDAQALDFAVVSSSDIAGTIDFRPTTTPTITASGGASVISGTPTFAKFTVTGSASESFSIALPSGDIVLSGTTEGVKVGSFESSIGTTSNLVDGTKVFTVGGILTVPAKVAAGTYSNATGLEVTVNYN